MEWRVTKASRFHLVLKPMYPRRYSPPGACKLQISPLKRGHFWCRLLGNHRHGKTEAAGWAGYQGHTETIANPQSVSPNHRSTHHQDRKRRPKLMTREMWGIRGCCLCQARARARLTASWPQYSYSVEVGVGGVTRHRNDLIWDYCFTFFFFLFL